MTKLCRVVICSALIGLVASDLLPDEARAQEPDRKVARIRMTAAELTAYGISVRGSRLPPFPNSCGPAGNPRLSVSDRLLQRFLARGFTLESVCLGLSSQMRFDPESGRQLPLAFVPELRVENRDDQEFRLDLPSCFRGGVSDLECNVRFDKWWGNAFDQRDVASHRESARSFDAMVRQHIRRNRVSGVFKVEDLGQGLFTSAYEWLLASPALPRGYGYALHGREGEDPEVEDVDLDTFRRKRGGGPRLGD
jgi:hypothetical protein